MNLTIKHGSRKHDIYEKAAQLFRDKGYLSTSMRELAQQVGLEPSSLYSHIQSKEEILQRICFDCADHFISGITEIQKAQIPGDEKLKRLFALHVSIAIDDPTSITVFNDEWRHMSEPHLTAFLKLRKTYGKRLLEILNDGIRDGIFKPVDPQLAAHTLLSSMRWLHLHSAELNEVNKEKYIHQLASLYLNGIQDNE